MTDCCDHNKKPSHDENRADAAARTHVAGVGEQATQRIEYQIDKMDCPTEENLIRNKLKTVEGIVGLEFNLMERRLTVHHSLPDAGPILAALEAIDLAPGATAEHPDGGTPTTGKASSGAARWLMALSGASALGAEVLAWTTGSDRSAAVIALALLSIGSGGLPTLKKGWIAIRNLTLNINFLMSVAVIGAIAIGQWPEAAMVLFLFGIAEMIEALSLDRARNAIRGLMDMSPENALVQQADGSWANVLAKSVQVDQQLRVKPGERIPLDGVITSGESAINQAPITGESMPVDKKVGDPVFAGTINETGSFEFKVSKVFTDTTLARIVNAVQSAQGERAPTQRFVDQFARFYTPAVLIIAVLLAVLPPLLTGAAWSEWLYTALVMLVIACPCALVISTPVTVVSGLAAGARLGILIKGGTYLEEGCKLKAIALDKTGTLTHGRPKLTDVLPLLGQAGDQALKLAASLDEHSQHPVATAIVTGWKESPAHDGVLAVEQFESLTGRGVKGVINGDLYYLGNHRLMEELGVCSPAVEDQLKTLELSAKTAVVLSSSTEALAILAVADTVKDSSRLAVQALKALGVESIMLTGDNQLTAEAIARDVGLTDVKGNLLPEDKLAIIAELQQRFGIVGMVGDGVNDAPALAKSSIGFAMGAAGTDTALETADVALMDDDLRKLPAFIELSRRTRRILWQNIGLALSIKAVFFVLALMGLASLWMAVFADMGASLLVVFNGLRLLRSNTSAT